MPTPARSSAKARSGLRAFFRSVTDWHRWLAGVGRVPLHGPRRHRRLQPRVPGAGRHRRLPVAAQGLDARCSCATSRGSAAACPGKARDFNWHNTIGFWSFAPLFVVVLSATVISYPVGEQPGLPRDGRATARAAAGSRSRGGHPCTGRSRAGPPAAPSGRNSRAALAVGPRPAPGPSPSGTCLAGAPSACACPPATRRRWSSPSTPGSGGEPQKRGTLTLDRVTGAVVKWETFASNSLGRRAADVLRFAHTGEVLGLPGQTIAGIASAGGAVLVYTGLALSLRRFVAWRRRRGAVDERQTSAA